MKKFYIILIICILIIAGICCYAFFNNKTVNQKEVVSKKDSEEINNNILNKTIDEFVDLNNDDKIVYNIGNRPGAGVIVDYDYTFENTDLLKEYDFLNRIYIPDYLVLGLSGKAYNTERFNEETKTFDKLDVPELIQNALYYDSKDVNDSRRPRMQILFSPNELALETPFYDGGTLDKFNATLDSTIAGIKVKLFKTFLQDDCNGELYFEYNGSKYYVEMNHFDEDEIDKVVISFVTEVRKGL